MTRQSQISLRFGNTLCACRHNRDLSLRSLEMKSGLSRGLLSKLENGNGNPSLFTLHKLADALRVGVTELIA